MNTKEAARIMSEKTGLKINESDVWKLEGTEIFFSSRENILAFNAETGELVTIKNKGPVSIDKYGIYVGKVCIFKKY